MLTRSPIDACLKREAYLNEACRPLGNGEATSPVAVRANTTSQDIIGQPVTIMLEGFDMGLLNRMIRAARLDASLYEEVEKDVTATNQALLVVVVASVCSGIGAAIGGAMTGGLGALGIGLVVGAISALVGWFVWSFVTYFIGTRLLKGPQTEATYGQLLRCIGFSDTPRILGILVFIPVIGVGISLLASIWSLVAMVVAVRQALDFSTGRAIATCIVGFIVVLIIGLLLGMLTGGLLAI